MHNWKLVCGEAGVSGGAHTLRTRKPPKSYCTAPACPSPAPPRRPRVTAPPPPLSPYCSAPGQPTSPPPHTHRPSPARRGTRHHHRRAAHLALQSASLGCWRPCVLRLWQARRSVVTSRRAEIRQQAAGSRHRSAAVASTSPPPPVFTLAATMGTAWRDLDLGVIGDCWFGLCIGSGGRLVH